MTKKIDAVLERVKDPETLLSVADLNLVSKVTYSESCRKFIVETNINSPRSACAVCGLITSALRESIQHGLEEEFHREFPGSTVIVTQNGAENG